MADWKRELQRCYRTRESLPDSFSLFSEEETFFEQKDRHVDDADFPVRAFSVTPYYLSLAEHNTDDPIRRQCIPTEREFTSKPYESMDPLSEKQFSPVPRLIHRYRDRVLVLTTGRCPVYCRHCFRRYFTDDRTRFLDSAEIEDIIDYVENHPEIKEVILSGGDPLMQDDDQLGDLLNRFWYLERDLRFRIGTRMPVVLPERITAQLAVMLRRFSPLWVVTQFNHPRELTEESKNAVSTLVDIGIPVLNQTVLLRGINDSPELLEDLFQELVQTRVKPYYLFQGDLAFGTSHFRTSISRGLELMSHVKNRVSGLAAPVYSVDLPDGEGKASLNLNSVKRTARNGAEWYEIVNREGKICYYPDET